MAVAFVIGAGFRSQGFFSHIMLATGAAVTLRITGLAMKATVSSQAALWPAMYAPPLLGIAVAVWFLAGRPLPWRRREVGPDRRIVCLDR